MDIAHIVLNFFSIFSAITLKYGGRFKGFGNLRSASICAYRPIEFCGTAHDKTCVTQPIEVETNCRTPISPRARFRPVGFWPGLWFRKWDNDSKDGKKEDCGENKNREEGHRDLIVAK